VDPLRADLAVPRHFRPEEQLHVLISRPITSAKAGTMIASSSRFTS